VVTNAAASFLYDVKLVINFAGAHGVEKRDIDGFEDGKLLDPDHERPPSMYDPMPVFVPAPPAGYPVEWRNKDTGLEVRITLAELPPGRHFEWDSADYEDVVLVAQPDVESVSATWVAIAS
jgi:hypothetical protein